MGRLGLPILTVFTVRLVVELSIVCNAAFKDAWLYEVAMVVIGPIYLAVLLAYKGGFWSAMPDMQSIDVVLDHRADTHHLR